MKSVSLFIIALVITRSLFGQQDSEKIDQLIAAYNKMDRFNGGALVAKKGVVLINKGYGFRNMVSKTKNDEQSIFQLGSITKQFTATVILKLAEEKKLNLQDHLSRFFPSYPKGDSITIIQLLSHTSGIFNYTNDGNFMANEMTKPASREKIMALFENKALDFSPGSGWNYSNSGFSMLGYIIEAITKMPYEKAVRNYIFTPLQMTHSGFNFAGLRSTEKTKGYNKFNEKDSAGSPVVDSSVSFSAGAIFSTTGDLYKWHQALETNRILSKEQQEAAYTPVKNNYGYGWAIDSIDGKRRVGHGGGIPGYITNISRVPADDVCIVLLSNESDRSLDEITKSIYAILYNKDYTIPKLRTAIRLPVEQLKDYEGTYEIRPDLQVVITVKDGQLYAAPTGQDTDLLLAEKKDLFFVKTEDLQVEFIRNEKQLVESFVLYQNGQKTLCKKTK